MFGTQRLYHSKNRGKIGGWDITSLSFKEQRQKRCSEDTVSIIQRTEEKTIFGT